MITMLRDKTLWGLILAVLFMMVGVGMIVVILPQRIVSLDGNSHSVGYLASAFAFSYILFQVPIGSLSDKLGFRPFLIIGYLLCFLAGLVFFFATSSGLIFFARFMQGVGEAPVWALAPALLSVKFPMAVAIGLFFSLFYVAISLSQVITGSLSDRFGWNTFMIIGLLVAAVGIIITPFLSSLLIFLPLTVASLGMGVFYLASMGFLNEIVPNSLKGTISGAYYLFWGVGMFFGPPIITKIASYVSFQASMTGYSFLMLLVASGMVKLLGWNRAEIKAEILN
ncbi:MFS transporter [Desulfosporosinus sp. BICA1-9]|uniref:MFS transporter n=1 Tax=Desulfosporosinus sp. BICA1-9 TaxID=1531958 RepID=UPI000B0EA24F|nr:MFS transporter [Desulfosporosinus sp. BICA1-9]